MPPTTSPSSSAADEPRPRPSRPACRATASVEWPGCVEKRSLRWPIGSVKPHRIAENFDVFDFALEADEVAAIDGLDTGVRGGPDPERLNRETHPKVVDNAYT
jgi:hypothetical protein